LTKATPTIEIDAHGAYLVFDVSPQKNILRENNRTESKVEKHKKE
jgi:hypothetical protein